MEERFNINEFNSPITSLFGIANLALIIFAIWRGIDPSRQIYAIILSVTVIFSIMILQNARKQQQPFRSGSIFFFVLIWLGITSFSDPTSQVDLASGYKGKIFFDLIDTSYLRLSIIQFNSLVLLPLAIYWAFPYSQERFFGLREVSEKQWIKSIWKIGIILILLIQVLELSTWFEVLVILPLIMEPVSLYSASKDELPLLTLHINQELSNKFAVPLSMLKGIGLIMIAFIFELIDGNFWLLVILLYLAAGFIWFLDFIIPESMKNQSDMGSESFEEFANMMSSNFSKSSNTKDTVSKSKPRRKRVQRDHPVSETDTAEKTIEVSLDTQIEPKEISEKLQKVEDNAITSFPADAPIGTKAHALGRRVRTELQKPQYNLNHILSTLSKEDFSSAFRVDQANYIFDSKQGEWSPPKDLILFPIDLEKYDYRRSDEIVLLGFNRPIEDTNVNFNLQFSNSSKYNTKISGNQIQIGDTTFNMKTLVVSKDQWEKIKSSLEIVDDVDDISYTGFNTLHHLQDKLVEISDKWIELRKKAEEAAINFMAGLLGSKDPIFLGKEDIEDLLEEGKEYEIEDVDD